MFIVLLKFSDNKAKAGAFMDGHKAWIQRGFAEDPFVAEGVVAAEIHEIAPARTDDRLAFLAA